MLGAEHKEIQEWIDRVEKMSALEAGALIGLLGRTPNIQVSQIHWNSVVGEGKCFSASRYLQENLDKLLEAFCTWSNTSKGDLTSDAVLTFLPALAAVGIHTSAGVATAVLAFMIKFGMRRICPGFVVSGLEGPCHYAIYPDNWSNQPQESIPGAGYGWIRYRPQIVALVVDPRFDDERHQIGVRSDGWAELVFKPERESFGEKILHHGNRNCSHQFALDDRRKRDVKGSMCQEEIRDYPYRGPELQKGKKFKIIVSYASLLIDGHSPQPTFIS